jgi:hypothetical protein
MSTVAESLVKTLAAAGVKRIYGIVGDSLKVVSVNWWKSSWHQPSTSEQLTI